MTPKDLRLNYHCQVKNSPFDEQLQIDIENYNHGDVKAYIIYLEEKLLEVQDKVKNFEK